MTWNTQLYEYGNRVGGKVKLIDYHQFHSLIDVVDKHLEKENAIAVLQEIPYKCNVDWKEHALFDKFNQHYSKDRYDVIYNISSNSQLKMTAVISKKGLIERNQSENHNCYVSFKIKNTDISALAVHSHNAFECREYLKRDHLNQYNMILGDFNAGNYKKNHNDEEIAINRQNYLLLTDGYIDICQGEYTTKYNTCIDHILLTSSYDFLQMHTYHNLNIDRKIKLSDHYPITFDFSVKEINYQ
jgi:hypothetical protein